MRVFVDTSSLFKKYVDEPGSDVFEKLLDEASEIAVSPVTWVEMNAAIERRLRGGHLTPEKAEWLRSEVKKDFTYFFVVHWNENLENKTVELIRKHSLRTMDAVQLASGVLSDAEMFATSDRLLYSAAKKTIQRARFV